MRCPSPGQHAALFTGPARSGRGHHPSDARASGPFSCIAPARRASGTLAYTCGVALRRAGRHAARHVALFTGPVAAQTRMPPLREPPVPPMRGTARPGPLSSLCYAALRWAGALGPALVTSVHPGLCPRPQLPARAAGGARESGRKGRRTQVSVIIPARSGRRARAGALAAALRSCLVQRAARTRTAASPGAASGAARAAPAWFERFIRDTRHPGPKNARPIPSPICFRSHWQRQIAEAVADDPRLRPKS